MRKLELTTVPCVNRKYEKFFDKHGYIPKVFNPYNCASIGGYAPTITLACGSSDSSATVIIIEEFNKDGKKRE